MEIDVQEFGPNSPLDYTQLNKIVLALREVAGELNEIVIAQASEVKESSGDTSVKTARFTLINTSTPFSVSQLPSTGETTPHEIDFVDPSTNAPFSFLEPPSVVFSVRHGSEQGICIANRIGKATNSGFKIKAGFIGKKTGSVVVDYIAIGLKAIS